MKRELATSQKTNDYSRPNKENPEHTTSLVSGTTSPNISPNYPTNIFQCVEDIDMGDSLSISSLMVTPQPKLTTFGTSVLDKYRKVGFLADAASSQKCWDFSCVPERVLRISIPNAESSENPSSNWVHVKIFKENMGQMKFHQLIILSMWEMRRVLSSLDEVFGEARKWFAEILESQESLKREGEKTSLDQFQTPNYPTPDEDCGTCDKFWELCEIARRKVCASLTSYDKGNFNRSYIQLRLYTRTGVTDNFTKKGVVNMKVGEIVKLLQSNVELMESFVRKTLNFNNKLTSSVSLPSLFM